MTKGSGGGNHISVPFKLKPGQGCISVFKSRIFYRDRVTDRIIKNNYTDYQLCS